MDKDQSPLTAADLDTYVAPSIVLVGSVTDLTGDKGSSYSDTGSGMAKGGSDDLEA